MSLRRVALILVVLAIAATTAFVVLTLRKEPTRPLSIPNFVIAEVRPVDPRDRPESVQRANEQAAKVVKLLNDYYLQAFLRPERWEPDPEASPPVVPPEQALAAFFTADAAPAVTRDLAALGLSDLAQTLERVDPSKQELTKLSVEFEDDGTTPFAVANVTFQALGTLKEEKERDGKPVVVQISHILNLWLVAEGDVYKIFSYSAELKADETVVSGAWGRVPGETLE